ncbi:UvrB/UvrC motif-containing protein [Caulobacter hibisci]|uniref:UvrB/UvrC motif-containing protein n=1 Tax=Caulobacter hibisci TaxID=2035993 RepID=A0ABS0SYP2_9CAUL|nr:UvrB/UvrC motif-containing protein [Caulobacter hibisci]MBI1683803.1 UvrB/UvrC motif-containing protein [Caulobacter hibisci]
MPETHIEALEQRMAQAVAAEDFEAAGRLRDEIAGLRRSERLHETPEDPATQASYFRRQVPGKMGLGTDQPVPARPPGWTPPQKPDPMTAGHSRGGRRKT